MIVPKAFRALQLWAGGGPGSIRARAAVELLDGGTGEELFRRGVPDDRKIWSAAAVVREEHHDVLRAVHRSFIAAGASYVTANNFGITPGVGFTEEQVASLTRRAAELAVEARAEAGKEAVGSVKVCGSLPPLVESYRPDLAMGFEEGSRWYNLIADALQSGGAEVLLAETLSSLHEMKTAVGAALGRGLPVFGSWTLQADGRLRSGETPAEAILALLDFTAEAAGEAEKEAAPGGPHPGPEEAPLGGATASPRNTCTGRRDPGRAKGARGGPGAGGELAAILFNCSEPEAITRALRGLRAEEAGRRALERMRGRGVRLGAYANRLTAVPEGWSLVASETPQAMRADLGVDAYGVAAEAWARELGVELIGGCCGVGPEYVSHLRDRLAGAGLLLRVGT